MNFKGNNHIHLHTAHGEEDDVDMIKHGPRFKETAMLLSNYDPVDIYNCDETGLYLKVLSNRTLSVNVVRSRKVIKDARVSILLCCNIDGSENRKPFVLSAHRPKGLDADTEARLKTDFKSSGYMTRDLFKNWLEKLDIAMEGRHIALLMDNAPGHANADELGLKNINVICLPLKTASVAQPIDAGIIRLFKVKNIVGI